MVRCAVTTMPKPSNSSSAIGANGLLPSVVGLVACTYGTARVSPTYAGMRGCATQPPRHALSLLSNRPRAWAASTRAGGCRLPSCRMTATSTAIACTSSERTAETRATMSATSSAAAAIESRCATKSSCTCSCSRRRSMRAIVSMSSSTSIRPTGSLFCAVTGCQWLSSANPRKVRNGSSGGDGWGSVRSRIECSTRRGGVSPPSWAGAAEMKSRAKRAAQAVCMVGRAWRVAGCRLDPRVPIASGMRLAKRRRTFARRCLHCARAATRTAGR